MNKVEERLEEVFVPDAKRIQEELINKLDQCVEALSKNNLQALVPCENTVFAAKPGARTCLDKAQTKARGMKEITWGRPLTPREYDYLCPACRAYWHLLAARNDLIEYIRRSSW